MDPQLEEALKTLTTALELVMNPTTPQEQRFKAGSVCEDFKETSPLCARCGLYMAQKEQPPIIRHFGMQLLEHCVKYRWPKLTDEEKMFIKQNSMDLIAKGTHGLLVEESHIKDVLSRIVVEMIKREWPQCWPTLLTDLSHLCSMGYTQTEVVLLIFQRLAEDAAVFQTIPGQRRKDIMLAINSNMTELFKFFLDTLQSSLAGINTAKSEGNLEQAKIATKVAEATMSTISSFADWMNPSQLFDKEGLLLKMQCEILADPDLQLPAVECLLTITSRKGKLEEREPIYLLFEDRPIYLILAAAQNACDMACEEKSYLFLKKLCQLLTSLGSQLLALWDVVKDCGEPKNFPVYLRAILAFTNHPSKTLCSYTQTLWAAFLRHEHISKNSHILDILPELVSGAKTLLLKGGFPSQTNHPSSVYSRMDFDSDEEYNLIFSVYRWEITETIRQATLLNPVLTFHVVSEWLGELLKKPIDVGDGSDSGHCNLSSPGFIEFDAMTVMLESVMSRLESSDKPKPDLSQGINLLKAVLDYQSQDPLILSSVLSCISSLFPMTMNAPDTLPTVLNKIFAAATFSLGGQTKATRSRAVLNVRRHACSVLVKICKEFPKLLLPGFDQLYSHIKQLSSDPEQLSRMEKCTLIEALILISNEYKDFNKQSQFIKETVEPVRDLWLEKELKSAMWSVDKFLNYVGLDQAAVEPSSEDTCGINRSLIVYCIDIILAVLKRSKCPDDADAAGGFVVDKKADGSVILRNPGTPHVIELLDNILALTRTLNELWSAANLAKRHADFSKAYELQEFEKLQLLGIQPPLTDNTDSLSHKQPLERMQNFISNVHDNCYHTLGNCCQCMGYDFYKMPTLSSSLLNSVFKNLDLVPDYRLKSVIRVFLKAFIQYCPKECWDSALLPVLAQFCPSMLQRLRLRWQVINQRGDIGEVDENAENKEILEDQTCRQLTRFYSELLGSLLISRKGAPEAVDDNSSMMVDEEQASQNKDNKEVTLSELGVRVLHCEMLSDGKLGPDDASHLYTMVLQSLPVNGQQEACLSNILSLGLQVYETLRPTHPQLSQIMLQVPNSKPEAIQAFDEKMASDASQPASKPSEKRRKDAYKKLVTGLIGKNVGQHFKKEQQMEKLPPMVVKSRAKALSVLEKANDDIGLCALFQADDVH